MATVGVADSVEDPVEGGTVLHGLLGGEGGRVGVDAIEGVVHY